MVFCNGDGTSIDVSSFKKRKPSEVQQVFDNDIQNIISKPVLEKGTGDIGGITDEKSISNIKSVTYKL